MGGSSPAQGNFNASSPTNSTNNQVQPIAQMFGGNNTPQGNSSARKSNPAVN
jgi:hypothetical protein